MREQVCRSVIIRHIDDGSEKSFDLVTKGKLAIAFGEKHCFGVITETGLGERKLRLFSLEGTEVNYEPWN